MRFEEDDREIVFILVEMGQWGGGGSMGMEIYRQYTILSAVYDIIKRRHLNGFVIYIRQIKDKARCGRLTGFISFCHVT